jgi:hypothetical protein
MAKLTPDIDNFTKGINKTIPSKTENLSPKLRQTVIDNSVTSVKGDICNKIDGAINLITGLKTGSNNLFGKIEDFDIDSFFEGPLQQINDKINDVVTTFNNSLNSFKNQEFNLQNLIDDQINKLNSQLTERFESTKIAVDGFDNSLDEIKNFTNKTIRDININPNFKDGLQSSLCDQSKTDMINNALKQKSITQLADSQEDLINKSNELINSVDLDEITSSFV